MPSSLAAAQIQNIVDAIAAQPEDLKHKWVSGQCAAFAVALGRIIERDCGVPAENIKVFVGTRYGLEDGEEVTVFSHATLGVDIGGESFDIDSNGSNAIQEWEDHFESLEFGIEKHDRSTFEWDGFSFRDVDAISAHIAEIDGSIPVQETEISFAETSIEKYIKQFNAASKKRAATGSRKAP